MNSPDFIFLFDWFKRNANWRVQTDSCCQRANVHRLETQPGCFGHVAAYFLSKRFYNLDTCVIFHEIMFFKELSAFIALYFIRGALFHSGRFYFVQGALFFLHSAFLFRHSALFRFLCESALVYFLQLWVSCAISLSLQSCSYYFNFLVWSAYLLINEWDFW